jgi:transposase-like protein
MSKSKVRVFTRAFKLSVLNRMAAGENVSALARELRLRRKLLYQWRDQLRRGGPTALRTVGRPRKAVLAAEAAAAAAAAPRAPAPSDQLSAARVRIAELERKVGQQQLDLDFFKRALRQVKASRRPNDGSGATASTHSSKR